MPRSSYRRTTPSFWFESIFKCCFVAIIGLFLVLKGEVAAEDNPAIPNTHAPYFLSDYTHHHHACSPIAPVESQAANGEESENDNKQETHKVGHSPAIYSCVDLPSQKLVFFQRKLVNESRAAISLIVLHHCWKSFLPEVS